MDHPILFYDGACKFCSHSVQYILKNEKQPNFVFAHLQDEGVTSYLENKIGTNLEDSMYVMQNNVIYKFSDASIKIAEQLKSPYSFLKYVKIIPRFLRDWGYKVIAKNRYKLAGRLDACIYPKALEGRIFKIF